MKNITKLLIFWYIGLVIVSFPIGHYVGFGTSLWLGIILSIIFLFGSLLLAMILPNYKFWFKNKMNKKSQMNILINILMLILLLLFVGSLMFTFKGFSDKLIQNREQGKQFCHDKNLFYLFYEGVNCQGETITCYELYTDNTFTLKIFKVDACN